MYDKSQVQNNGRENVATSSDSKRRSGDSNEKIEDRTCKCGKVSYSIRSLSFHKSKCNIMIAEEKERVRLGLAGGSLVKCALCDEVGSSLALHVRKIHKLDKKEYVKKYGPVIAPESSSKYSKAGEKNGDWINRAKENGQDLTEYWQKVSKSVSESIMNSPEERVRRAGVLAALNKTQKFRDKASETAKKTSLRKEILEKRSAQLKRWRDNNKQEFYVKCTSNMHKYKSVPEKLLYNFVSSSFSNLNFLNNKFIKDSVYFSFNKTRNKQVDIISSCKSIAIEFDGFLHFKEIWPDSLLKIKEKDSLFSQYCIDKKITLIRVSHDTYSYKAGRGFCQSTIQKISDLIDNPAPGVHFVGNSWNGQDYTHITSKEDILKIYGV